MKVCTLFYLVISSCCATPYNVLLIIADDLRPTLGAYSHPVVKSPHIDTLMGQSVQFMNMHTQVGELIMLDQLPLRIPHLLSYEFVCWGVYTSGTYR